MQTDGTNVSTTRLYGSVIAFVSGGYSCYLATTGDSMSTAAWGMLALGAVVIIHGIALLTPAARLGSASGPLMIVYAAVMLLNQLWMESRTTGSNMAEMGEETMGQPAMDGAMAAGADPGMVAIAALMLASGIIMTVRSEPTTGM